MKLNRATIFINTNVKSVIMNKNLCTMFFDTLNTSFENSHFHFFFVLASLSSFIRGTLIHKIMHCSSQPVTFGLRDYIYIFSLYKEGTKISNQTVSHVTLLVSIKWSYCLTFPLKLSSLSDRYKDASKFIFPVCRCLKNYAKRKILAHVMVNSSSWASIMHSCLPVLWLKIRTPLMESRSSALSE